MNEKKTARDRPRVKIIVTYNEQNNIKYCLTCVSGDGDDMKTAVAAAAAAYISNTTRRLLCGREKKLVAKKSSREFRNNDVYIILCVCVGIGNPVNL